MKPELHAEIAQECREAQKGAGRCQQGIQDCRTYSWVCGASRGVSAVQVGGAGGEKRQSQEGLGGLTLASSDGFIACWAFALSGGTESSLVGTSTLKGSLSHFWGV